MRSEVQELVHARPGKPEGLPPVYGGLEPPSRRSVVLRGGVDRVEQDLDVGDLQRLPFSFSSA